MHDKEIIKRLRAQLRQKSNLKEHYYLVSSSSNQTIGFEEIININKKYSLVLLNEHSELSLSMNTFKRFLSYGTNDVHEKNYQIESINQDVLSYAVIKKENLKLLPIIAKIDELYHQKLRLLIAIDGYAASGKSTLSELIAYLYGGNVFHIDDFFKKIDPSIQNPIEKHGNNIDFNKINETVLTALQQRQNVIYRPFDFKLHIHLEPKMITYKPINIIEGAYSMHPNLIANYDYQIFMKIGFFKELMRIYHRNGLKGLLMFIHKWIPRERKYFKAFCIEQKADVQLKA